MYGLFSCLYTPDSTFVYNAYFIQANGAIVSGVYTCVSICECEYSNFCNVIMTDLTNSSGS